MKSATLAKPKDGNIPVGTKVKFGAWSGIVVDVEYGAVVARNHQYKQEIIYVRYHNPVYLVRRKQILPNNYNKACVRTPARIPAFSKQGRIVRMFADEFQRQN